MTTSRLSQIAEDMARRAEGCVLDYETPPPRPTAWDVAWGWIAWCGDSVNLLAFCLGMAALIVGGSMPDTPALAGMVLLAAGVLWMFATVRWAYGRPGRW